MLILAYNSQILLQLLHRAGLDIEVKLARVDEEATSGPLLQEGFKARDMPDALAKVKACKISMKIGRALVFGRDQILEFDGRLISKADSFDQLFHKMQELLGKMHKLCSFEVTSADGKLVCRKIGETQVVVRDYLYQFLRRYLDRNFNDVKLSVGRYQIGCEGWQLIEDY